MYFCGSKNIQMHFLSSELEQYVENHSSAEPELLQELSRETHLKVLQPRMLSGHFQGRVLSILSKMISPKYILEIGTFTGYATLCLAEGLSSDGILHTIDVNEELAEIQDKYFEKSPFRSQIVQHIGHALDIIPTLPNYFDAVIKKMKKGGIILSDNVLWSGKILEEVKNNDKHTQILLEYNKKINTDPRVESVLLPIRDGLTISRVK